MMASDRREAAAPSLPPRPAEPPRANAPGGRIVSFDALRGLAVIGIVPMNVLVFAMPGAAYVNPRAWGGDGPLEIALWALVFLIIEDKFRNLFAMLFGAGVAILLARQVERPLAGHYARMAVLFVIGFAHASFLANNDILRLYALTGLALPLFLRLSPRALLLIAAALIAAQTALAGWYAFDWLAYWWRWWTGAISAFGPLARAEAAFGADPDALAFALERGRETLAERLYRRLSDIAGPLVSALAAIPSTLAAMLVGMALWRNGLLAGAWPPEQMRRLACRAIAWSLPALVLLAAGAVASGFSAVVTAANALIWSAPFDLLLAVGWAALAMAWFSGREQHGMAQRLAASGRMALTNYLATSLILSAIYAHWGLGLFGDVSRVEALATCLLPIGAMLLWSPCWLARFRQGPMEWLWRSLAHGAMLPVRRDSARA